MARIIVIDDDKFTREALEKVLLSAGHEVRTAGEGRAGIALHRAIPAELIVTDIFMPCMEGLETIMAIRKTDKDVRILAITAVRDLGNPLAAAQKLGADRIMEKPFKPYQFLDAVKDTLMARR